MIEQIVIRASEGHRTFKKLIDKGYISDEHIIVERDGFPVMVMLSYQEYEQLSQPQIQAMFNESLAPVVRLE